MELLKKVGCFLKRINVKGLHYARLINSQDDFILNKMKFKYNLNEFLKIQKISVEYFEKNKSAFNNFYDDSKDDIKEINRLILK